MFNATVLDERDMVLLGRRGLDADGSGEVVIKSPMPGLIVQVLVEEGQTVQKGATLLILESMKMQNELKSPRDGIIQRISVGAGDTVEQNRILITLT
ncbi:MAG UNVERIFIED_CONTAM: acetyl-CoA carboxylase biotin carboxyl carrier protein subunit [Anaerolineae bacterium]